MKYHILAFYNLKNIENPNQIVLEHKEFIDSLDITCRVFISSQGINGQLSASEEASKIYRDFMKNHPIFFDTQFKVDPYTSHAFPRKTVKLKEKLVGGDESLNLEVRGEYLSPQEWDEKIKNRDQYRILDIRNDYEWEVGHFKGAENPQCKNFRDFERKAEMLAKELIKEDKPALMYCTGGIRCELYSSLLKKHGVKKLFQLEGGVIEYGKQTKAEGWKGELFVFDDRMTTQVGCEPKEPISRCHKCHELSSSYFNCANMDCNKLFISCIKCLKDSEGCCDQSDCKEAPRKRPLTEQNPQKPFRRKSTLNLLR